MRYLLDPNLRQNLRMFAFSSASLIGLLLMKLVKLNRRLSMVEQTVDQAKRGIL